MNTRTIALGGISRRMLAVAAVSAITLSLALTMRVALANDLHQDPGQDGISWNDPAFQGDEGECEGTNLEPGQVLWHFVHTKTDSGDLPSQLTAEFADAGVKTADGYVNGNSIVQYVIITGEDSLLSASDDIENDGLLNLSHICSNHEEEESVAESVAESVPESGEQSVEAGTGTPEESTPDGALSFAGSSALPTIAFSLILLVALGGLAYANVKAARNIG